MMCARFVGLRVTIHHRGLKSNDVFLTGRPPAKVPQKSLGIEELFSAMIGFLKTVKMNPNLFLLKLKSIKRAQIH
jgi:hypothetical protein